MARRVWFLAAILAASLPVFALANNKALLERADKYADEGQIESARRLYEQAIKEGADLTGDAKRSHSLGLCYLNGSTHDFAQAAKWLGIAVGLAPQDEQTRVEYAQALGWSGQYASATEQYEKLLQQKPSSSAYVIGLANVFYWKGSSDQAVGALQTFLERNPSDVAVRLETARLLGYARRYPEALGQYQAVLQQEPANMGAQIGIAKIYSWQNEPELALQMFDKVLAKHPGTYDALVGKAFTLMWVGRRDEARPLFKEAVRKNPRDKEVAEALKQLGPEPAREKPAVVAEKAAPAPPPVPQAVPADSLAETKSQPIVIAPVTPEVADPIPGLLRDAEAASAKGDFAGAAEKYAKVVALKPGDRDTNLQLARVLSWGKQYDQSVARYDALLTLHPQDADAAGEKARVLSWARKYDESIAQYKTALELAPADHQREVRVEYARVLAWSRRYPEALAQIEQALPSDAKLTDADRGVLLDKAHMLAWSQKYPQSIAAYDQLIALGGDTFDARLGKAQVLYWSGMAPQADAVLRPLLIERPKDPELNFTTAAVENALGHQGKSLSLLSYATANSETEDLRKAIVSNMRPVVRLRAGFEDDRETDATVGSSIRAWRVGSSVEFSPHPDVRLEISNSMTWQDTSNSLLAKNGGDAFGVETMIHARLRPANWLSLNIGVGQGSTGANAAGQGRQQQEVYDAHPVIEYGRWRVDLTATRHIADYTSLALRDNVMNRRESAGLTYNDNHILAGGEYWHGHYSADSPETGRPRFYEANANGGALYARPKLYTSDNFSVDAGVRTDFFGYDNGALAIADPVNGIGSAGFFTPKSYVRYAGTGHVDWKPKSLLEIELDGSVGPQKITGFAALNPPPPSFQLSGSGGAQASLLLGKYSPYVRYDYFSTATPAFVNVKNGSYASHVFSFGLNIRF